MIRVGAFGHEVPLVRRKQRHDTLAWPDDELGILFAVNEFCWWCVYEWLSNTVLGPEINSAKTLCIIKGDVVFQETHKPLWAASNQRKSSTLCKLAFITRSRPRSRHLWDSEAAGEKQAQICFHSKVVPIVWTVSAVRLTGKIQVFSSSLHESEA